MLYIVHMPLGFYFIISLGVSLKFNLSQLNHEFHMHAIFFFIFFSLLLIVCVCIYILFYLFVYNFVY